MVVYLSILAVCALFGGRANAITNSNMFNANKMSKDDSSRSTGKSSKSKKRSTIMVDSGESIQNAVDSASPGDTISIGPGIYNQSITVDKDDLKLIAREGVNTVVITGFDLGNVHGVHVRDVKGVKLRNLVVQGFRKRIAPAPPFNLFKGLLLQNSEHCSIEYNVFRDNGDGVFSTNSSHNRFIGNLAEHNYHDGFFIRDGSRNNTVESNTVLDNGPDGNRNDPPDAVPVPLDGGCGIQLTNDANDNRVSKNLAARNARGLQIDRRSTGNVLNWNRIFSSTKAGIIVQEFQGNPTPVGNLIVNNTAMFNMEFDLWELNSDSSQIGNIWKCNEQETANPAEIGYDKCGSKRSSSSKY